MNKFIKEHGQVILWFVFLVFMIISLSMVFTHGIRYAIVVFVLSFILLCPPIVKFIQRKTRLKKSCLRCCKCICYGVNNANDKSF